MTENRSQLILNSYHDGRLARREGKENTDNPYSDIVNPELFDAWADGYWDEHESLTVNKKGECAT